MKFTRCIIILSLLLLSAESPKSEEWECLPGSDCEIPNKNVPRPKGYELSDSQKFEVKKEKFLAQEPNKYKSYAQKNKRELGLDKPRRGHFSAWSFPQNTYN